MASDPCRAAAPRAIRGRAPAIALAAAVLLAGLGARCGAPPAELLSDDFNDPSLRGRWSFEDPVGDSAWALTGAGTGDAHLELSVPAGTNHDPVHPNRSARMMQAVQDGGDFEVEAKFDSAVSERFEIQGILVRQDADHYVRFEFFSDGAGTRFYAETTVAGEPSQKANLSIAAQAPLYLRVARTGDEWVGAWSSDGIVWTEAARFLHPLEVGAVGLVAGNAGGGPAHTARVDYFSNTASPVAQEDGLACAPSESFVLESTVQGPGQVVRTPAKTSYACGEVVTLEARPDPGGFFASWAGDLSGVENPHPVLVESPLAVGAAFVADTFPPLVSGLSTSAGETSATIVWSTNEPSTGEVDYGETPAFELGTVPSSSGTATSHSVELTGLAPDRVYHVRVRSADPWGNTREEPGFTFSTAPARPPALGEPSVAPGTRVATIRWTTDEPATSVVEYGTTPAYELGSASDPTLRTDHEIILAGLETDTLYHYRVISVDEAGNPAIGADRSFRTLVPALSSDDFNAPELAPFWSFVNPRGEASYAIEGAGSGDARLRLSIPAGISHDPLFPNASARLMQPAADRDFQLEAKFDSAVSQRFQIQGLLVEQDPDDYLRFEFYSDGFQTFVYADATRAGTRGVQINQPIQASAPLFLRVDRSGDVWSVSWSEDGVSWNPAGSFVQGLTVQQVGVSGGNAGANPAHEVLVDYVFETAAPVLPEDGLECALGSNFALDAEVLGQGALALAPDRATYACGELVELQATPAPGWVFADWGGDVSGTTNPRRVLIEADTRVVANFVPDVFPPAISGVAVETTETSATVTWSTDEPSTSDVHYGTTTAYELGSLGDAALVPAHEVVLSGLTPDTEYHYQIRSADGLGNEAVDVDRTFRTAPLLSPVPVASDDFDRSNLSAAPWSFRSPGGSARIELSGAGTPDAWVSLAVPSGAAHPIGAAGNQAAQLAQDVANGNFEVEARLESQPVAEGTGAGLFAAESASRFVYAGIERRGGALHLVAASVGAGGETVHVDRILAEGAPHHLRLAREGTRWELAYSADGSLWTSEPAFTTNLGVGEVGIFAASEGSAPQAYRADFDYVFDTADPVVPEDDGSVPADILPPLLHALTASPTATTLAIGWGTDEPADGRVEYGQSSSLELGSVSHADLRNDHLLLLEGLSPSTVYFFRVVSTDAAGNTSVSPIQTVQTGTLEADGPTLDLWFGEQQAFGALGIPQRFANILGSARDEQGVESLTYSLNGGPEVPLTAGGDHPRLVSYGDFNAEIPFGELLPGPNEVRFRGVDGIGNVTTRTVDLEYVDGNVWPLPYSIDWSLVSEIPDVAQVVDGEWQITGNGVRTAVPGYDRLIAIGDLAWTEYEVEVPITVHSVGQPKSAPLVGLAVRWTGHFDWDGSQPRIGWHPLGGIVSHTWRSSGFDGIELWRPDGFRPLALDDVPELALDVPYVFKLRVTELGDGQIRYRFRFWREGEPEPTAWLVDHPSQIVPPVGGSLLLVAHHVDATFGDVSIVPASE